jgi:signal transduction histidine kinase
MAKTLGIPMAERLTRNAHALAFAAAFLLLAAIGLASWIQFSNSRAAQFWVRHTYEVLRGVDGLGLALREAETGQRGFLLTGDQAYLAPYNGSRDQVVLLQGELRRLTADNPAQQENLRALGPLVERKMDELAQTIQLRRDKGFDAALRAVQTNAGLELDGQIRDVVGRMSAEEDALLTRRLEDASTSDRNARLIAVFGALLGAGLLAAAFRLLAVARARLAAAEATQRQLAEQMRAAFDSVTQGIALFDADAKLSRWNRSFKAHLDLPDRLLAPGVPYADIARQAADVAKAPFLESPDQIEPGRSGRRFSGAVVYERTMDDGRTFEMRRSQMNDGGFVLTLTDFTERMRAERAARDAQRIQAMGQLTGGIAHDFNNLLTVILGNLELARGKVASEGAIKHLERATWAGKRGASLTQQLLAFARRQPLAPMPIDLSAALPELASLLRRTLGEQIDIRVIDTAGLWPAMADPAQVESALLNLALNARDSMPTGGRLTIEVANKVLDADYAARHAEVSPGDYVMLAVSDTGAGMAPEVVARAFEPFFTTKEAGKGTGLGLAMVLGFAKQSGGHVKIYSEPGHGTTVRLYLPRAIGVSIADRTRTAAPLDLPRGGASILLLEDDASVREVAAGMLRDLGYRVLEAEDGADALRTFKASDGGIDLLLADVVLPGGMKGNEVARRLQALRPDLRVLFMSGYTENAIVHHGRLDDGVQLIGKPFTREVLARKISEILSPSGPPKAQGPGNVIQFPDHGAASD